MEDTFGIYGDDGNIIPFSEASSMSPDFIRSHGRGDAGAIEAMAANAEAMQADGAMADDRNGEPVQSEEQKPLLPMPAGTKRIQDYARVFSLDEAKRDLLAAEPDDLRAGVQDFAQRVAVRDKTDADTVLKRLAVAGYYARIGSLSLTPGQCYVQADSLARHYGDGEDAIQAYDEISRRINPEQGGWGDTAKAAGYKALSELHGTAAGLMRLAGTVDHALGGTSAEQLSALQKDMADTSRWLREKTAEYSVRGMSDGGTPFIQRLNTKEGWEDMAKFIAEQAPSDILHRSEMMLGPVGPMLMFLGAEYTEEMQLRDEHPGRGEWAILGNASANAAVDTVLDGYMFQVLTGPVRSLAYRFGIRNASKAIAAEAAAGAVTNATEEGLGQAVQDATDIVFAALSGEKDERTKSQMLKDICQSSAMSAIVGAASGATESVGFGMASQPKRYRRAREVTDAAMATIGSLSGKDVVTDADAMQIGVARLVVRASEQGDLDGVLQYGMAMDALRRQISALEAKREMETKRIQLQMEEYSSNPELEGSEAIVPPAPTDEQVVSAMLSDAAISENRVAEAELAAAQYAAGQELRHADHEAVVENVRQAMMDIGADGSVEVDSGVTWENLRHRRAAEALGYDMDHIPRAMDIGGRLWINSDRTSPEEARDIVLKWSASRNLQRIAPDSAMAEFYDGAAQSAEMRAACLSANGKEEAETVQEKAAAAREMLVSSRMPAIGEDTAGALAMGFQAIRKAMRGDRAFGTMLSSDRELQVLLSRAMRGGGRGGVLEFLRGQPVKAWDAVRAIADHAGIPWRNATDEEVAAMRERAGGDVEVNGWYDSASGQVVVAPGSDPVWAFGHEAWHWMAQNRPDVLDELRGVIDEVWSKAQMDDFVAGPEGKAYSDVAADAMDEVYANRLGDLVGSPAALEAFSRELERSRAGAGRRFLMAVQDFLRSVAQALTGKARTDMERAAAEAGRILAGMEGNGAMAREGGANKFSLAMRDDGRKYVKVDIDQSIFDGLSPNECRKMARKVILERFRGKVIGTAPDNAYVSRDSADEYAYPAARRALTNDVLEHKARASVELDSIMNASQFKMHIDDDGRHPKATGGWDHYSVEFAFPSGRSFTGIINIMVTDNGRVFYDMTEIKEVHTSVSGSNDRMHSMDSSHNIPPSASSEGNDLQFSLRSKVERTPDLLAIHNMNASSLLSDAELGGLAMPSIAIIKDSMPHGDYGDVSLLFRPSAIDPKKDRRNRIYSGDAWTPTFPVVENNVDWDKAEKVGGELKGILGKAGLGDIDGAYRLDNRYAGLDDYFNSGDPIEILSYNTAVRSAYLLDIGETIGASDKRDVRNEVDGRVSPHDVKFREWLRGKYQGTVVGTGIRNGKPSRTPSGSLRKFESFHDPVTLASVVKAMLKTQPEHGGTIFGKNPYGAATEKYGSLKDVILDEKRLAVLGDDELKALKDEASQGIRDAASSISSRMGAKRDAGTFGSFMDVADDLIDSYLKGRGDPPSVKAEMNRGGFYGATDEEIALLCDSMKAMRSLPTKYFEAKPQRAVMFDEVAAAVIPDTAGDEVRRTLDSLGIRTYSYRKDDVDDRMKAVNRAADELSGIRFSLSGQSGQAAAEASSRRIDDYYTAAQQVQIVQMMVPFVQRNLCGRAQEARRYLEAMGVDIARDEDAAYFAEMARQSLEASDAGTAARRLDAAKKYGVVSKELRGEVVKLLVPLARDGRSLPDAVEFLKGQGIAVTSANAERLYEEAMREAAPKSSDRRRQKVRDWLHGRSNFFQILEKAGQYGKVVPSARFKGDVFSGSFIDPVWVRYSGRSFKNINDAEIARRLQKAARDHSAFASDMLAKMYADEFGGDATEIEEEMLDYFNGKTWQDLEGEMLEEERSMAAEWRGQEEDAWRAWLESAMPIAEEHVRRRLPLTREMAEDEPDLARLVCELYDGAEEKPLSHGFRDVSDEWLEGFNYAVSKGMRSRLGEFADAYEQACRNPVYGDSRPLPARAFDIMERAALKARAAGAESELRRKNSRIAELETAQQRADAMLDDARAALEDERRGRLSDVSELRAKLAKATSPGYTAEQADALRDAAAKVTSGMDEATASRIVGEILHIADYKADDRRKRIDAIMAELDMEATRQARESIRKELLDATKRWHSRTTRKGIPVGFAADGQRTVDRIASILRMGDTAAMNAILETSMALQQMQADGRDSASVFGNTMSRQELERELHLLQTFGFAPGTTAEQARQARAEFDEILMQGRSEFDRRQAERMARFQKAGAEIKEGLAGTRDIVGAGVKDRHDGDRANLGVLLAQADPLTLFHMVSGDDVDRFDDTWLGRQWLGIEKATYGENARNVRDGRAFSDAVMSVVGSRKASAYARFLADAAEERPTGATIRVYQAPRGDIDAGTDYMEFGRRWTIRRRVSIEDARRLLAEYDQTGKAVLRSSDGDLALDDINAAFLRKQIADVDSRVDVDYQPFADDQANAAFLEQLKAAREAGEAMMLIPHPKETWTEEPLVLSRGQALQAILTWEQPDAQAIMRWNGWTDDAVSRLRDYCGDKVMKLGDWMRQTLADSRQELDDVAFGQFGARMPDVENYFPTRYARATRGGNDIRLGTGTPKSLETGFLVQRRFHVRPLDLSADAFQVFRAAQADQAHYIEFAPVMSELRGGLLQADVKDAIVNRYSREFLAELQDRLRVIEGGGRNGEAVPLVSTLMRGFVNKSLAFNVVSGMKQMLSTTAYMNNVTPAQFVSAMAHIGSRDYIEFLKAANGSEYMETRAKGGFNADLKWLQDHAADGSVCAKAHWLSGLAYSPITLGDKFSSLVGGYPAYRSAMEAARKAGLGDDEAKAKALHAWQVATDQTQQGSYMKDMNRLQTSTGPARLLTMFLSNPIQVMNGEVRQAMVAAAEYRHGKKTKAALRILNQALVNHLLVPSAMLFVADFVKAGFDIQDWWDETDLAEYVVAWILGPFDGFALIGQAVSATATAIAGKAKQWGKSDSPTDILKGTGDNVGALFDGELSEKDAEAVCDILLAAGAATAAFGNTSLGDAVVDLGTLGSAALRQGKRMGKAAGVVEDGKKKKTGNRR